MPADSELSERELQILKLVATGASNKEIAQQLVISPNTVKVHLRNIFGKIGVVSRTEATLYALKIGLVRPEVALDADAADMPAPNAIDLMPLPWYRLPALQTGLVVAIVLLVASAVFLLAGGVRLFAPQSTGQLALPAVAERWSSLAQLPEGRSAAALERYENTLFVIGGEAGGEPQVAVFAYDQLENSWSQRADKPTATAFARAAVIGEKIYLPGGTSFGGAVSDRLEVYDPRGDSWSEAARLPYGISDYGLAAFEGRLYLFGGWDGQAYRDTVLIYDPADDTWSAGQSIPGARGGAAAVVLGAKIYLVGGRNSEIVFPENLVYFPNRAGTNEPAWETRAPLPGGRSGFGAAALAEGIYIAGGLGGDWQPLDTVLRFDEASNTWETIEDSPLPVGVDCGLVAFNTRLHLIGGLVNEQVEAQHQAYQALYTVLLPAVSR